MTPSFIFVAAKKKPVNSVFDIDENVEKNLRNSTVLSEGTYLPPYNR